MPLINSLPGSNYSTRGNSILPMSLNAMMYMGNQGRTTGQNPFAAQNPFGGFGGGMGGMGGGSIWDLIKQQRELNAADRAKMEANWEEGKGMLMGIPESYMNDPMTQGARRLAQGLLDNPEAINDETQGLIRNQLMNQLGAQSEVARRRQTGALASRGQMNPAALARMNQQLGSQEQSALSRAMAGTEIERALRKNQDITNAAGLGRQLGLDQSGVRMGTAQTYLQNMPQYQPEDLSGMAALLFRGQGGGGLFGAGGSSGQNSSPSFGFQVGALNPWGQQSPGQPGFAPGLNGNYSWTGRNSGGGYGGYDPTQYYSYNSGDQGGGREVDYSNWSQNFYNSLGGGGGGYNNYSNRNTFNPSDIEW